MQRKGSACGATQQYQRHRARARRRPAIWLRYRERQIVTRRPRPSNEELAELAAIRRELKVRRPLWTHDEEP
jgi:hypothetical protein